MKFTIALAVLLIVAAVNADVYMQNPRGSNDRLNGQNANRDNGNRLFDSQNNGKGGYCWGPALTYYEGSQLTIEYTSQHACGNEKADCEIVMQYTCSDSDEDYSTLIRDGQTTTTIPDDENQYMEEADGAPLYGMHESYEYYQECKTRARNGGLYIADRNVGGAARNTRQNNNGNRNGFECPEERDYYPYWHPSIWRDINVFTTNTDRCDYYQAESENVKDKNYCANPAYNNKAECEQNGAEWMTSKAFGIDSPDCSEAPYSRDNHLGNAFQGGAAQTANYNWTLPGADELKCVDKDNCNCVFRLRYNISTTDFDAWKTDYASNGAASPVYQDPYAVIAGSQMNLSLAIDTSQFARTFQDRSHVFHIAPRSKLDLPDTARIYNLNVRGKRGNIVQTYPATEYDFVPTDLAIKTGDYVHYQWTGCDTNPTGNAGEGTQQTDRNNIVQVDNLGASFPVNKDVENPMFEDSKFREYMAFMGQDLENCPTLDELEATNNDDDDIDRDPTNCAKLNAAPTPYFDGGVIKMNNTGTYHYMSTRNNNFTNRGQKASLVVEDVIPIWAIILIAVAGAVFLAAAGSFGAMMYAKSHPHSAVAEFFDRF